MTFFNVNLPGAALAKLPRRAVALTVQNAPASMTASRLGASIVGVAGAGATITTYGAYMLSYLELWNNSGGVTNTQLTLTVDGRVLASEASSPMANNNGIVLIDGAVTGPIYSKSNIIIFASAAASASLGYALQQLESS